VLMAQRPRGGVSDLRWFYTCIVFPVYFASILFVMFLPAPVLCSAAAVALAVFKVGVCMSVCLHRYAAHAAFKCGPITSLVVQCIGCLANQGGPLWWASNHRCHHKFCDTQDEHHLDPHSPELVGQANAFAFLAEHKELKEEFVPRHCDSPAARLLDTWAILPCWAEYALAYQCFGAGGLWASFVSGWFSQVLTLWFNVVNHLPDPADDASALYNHCGNGLCKATDGAKAATHVGTPNVFFDVLNSFLWIAWLTGESTHGHHHAYGNLAHRPGVDLPYHVFVRPLMALGLLTDVKTAGRELVAARHVHTAKKAD